MFYSVLDNRTPRGFVVFYSIVVHSARNKKTFAPTVQFQMWHYGWAWSLQCCPCSVHMECSLSLSTYPSPPILSNAWESKQTISEHAHTHHVPRVCIAGLTRSSGCSSNRSPVATDCPSLASRLPFRWTKRNSWWWRRGGSREMMAILMQKYIKSNLMHSSGKV